jgi:hypothetical protein
LENVHEWRAARTGTKDVSRDGGIRHAEVAFITLGAKDSADRTRMSWALYWNTFVLLRDGYHWPIIGGRTANSIMICCARNGLHQNYAAGTASYLIDVLSILAETAPQISTSHAK